MPAGTTATGSSLIAGSKIAGYATAVACFNFLHIPQEGIFILSILMAIDFMTGVGKQLRIDKRKLTSHAAWLGIAKKLLVFVMIGAMSLAFVGLKLNPDQLLDTTFAILITSELYSILQNIYAIRTGLILPEFDVVSTILKTFGDFLKDKLDKMTKIQSAMLEMEERRKGEEDRRVHETEGKTE